MLTSGVSFTCVSLHTISYSRFPAPSHITTHHAAADLRLEHPHLLSNDAPCGAACVLILQLTRAWRR